MLRLAAFAAALWATTASAQSAPSQWEVNGFLLGQHLGSIEAALGQPFRVDTEPGGWTYRIYVIDRERNGCMVFKFVPERPNYAYAIQIAGRPGTPMRPFLGLLLGASRSEVLRRLGKPSSVRAEPELGLQLLEYRMRNYSVELDSTGALSSILVFGYDGFSERPADGEPDPLQRLRAALSGFDVDSLMRLLAPDIEIYRNDQSITFRRAPRTDLSDTASALRLALADTSGSVRSGIAEAPSDTAVRVHENGPIGLVYKYDHGPLREIVFTYYPGGYRLWEVAFR